MLATTNGDLWLLSTPNAVSSTKRQHGGPAWFRISVPATKCPRIFRRVFENAVNTLDAGWFAREYMAEFVDNGMSCFNRDLIRSRPGTTASGLAPPTPTFRNTSVSSRRADTPIPTC